MSCHRLYRASIYMYDVVLNVLVLAENGIWLEKKKGRKEKVNPVSIAPKQKNAIMNDAFPRQSLSVCVS